MGIDPVSTMDRACRRIAELEGERDGWIQSAKELSDGVEYYRGIVDQIGNLFGVVARTADDGSVYDSVLRAKVFDLVSQLIAANVDLREALDTFSRAWVISLAPFNYRLDDGAAKYIPGGWPTVGEFKAAHTALTNPASTEALERVRKEAKVEVLDSLKKQAEDLRTISGKGSLRARLLALVVDELLDNAAALRGGE